MYKTIKEIPNPYQPFQPVRDEKLFIGRKYEINRILNAIDDYLRNNIKKDFIIYGEKAIGKSSFLNILREKIYQKQLLVIKFDIKPNTIENSLVFFKELFDAIFESTKGTDLFTDCDSNSDYSQREIWEALTIYGEHDSYKIDRRIILAEIYSQYLNQGKIRDVSSALIKSDFNFIMNEIKKEYAGLVLMFDEFHLLKQNENIIYILQDLMVSNPNIFFIFCGNEILKEKAFEKLHRNTEIVQLEHFKGFEIYDLIFKPIMNFGFLKDEIENEFDTNTLKFLFSYSNFNPYHINLLLYYMFDAYKNNQTEKITINEQILERVISHIKLNSPLNETITAQLNASNEEQLQALIRLLPYQSINLADISLIMLSFNKVKEDLLEQNVKKVIKDLIIIKPLKLVKIYPENLDLEELLKVEITRNKAAEIKYEFLGDNIDEIYLSYLIETSFGKNININKNFNFNNILAFKLNLYLLKKLEEILEIDKEKEIKVPVAIKEIEKSDDVELNSNKIQEKIKIIYEKAKTAENRSIDEQELKEIQKALNGLALRNLIFVTLLDSNKNSFYFIFIKARIRNKIYCYEFFISTNNELYEDFILYISDKLFDEDLKDYNIEILDSIVLPILPQLIYFITFIDTNEIFAKLIRNLQKGKYEESIPIIELLTGFNYYNVDEYHNNLGFLYLCCGNFDLAKRYLENVNNPFIVTNCNFAYLHYRLGDYNLADTYLKRAEKNYKKLKDVSIKEYLVIHQILIPLDKRHELPKDFDIILEPNIELIILGNRAILASFKNQNHGFNLIKNINVNDDLNKFYKNRYTYYLYYNLSHKNEALKNIELTENEVKKSEFYEYLKKFLEWDKKIIK